MFGDRIELYVLLSHPVFIALEIHYYGIHMSKYILDSTESYCGDCKYLSQQTHDNLLHQMINIDATYLHNVIYLQVQKLITLQ